MNYTRDPFDTDFGPADVALDLDAIKARADKLHRAHIMGASREDSVSTYSEARDDIRALVAEVERLQGLLDRNFRAYLSIQGIPDDQIDAEIARRNSGAPAGRVGIDCAHLHNGHPYACPRCDWKSSDSSSTDPVKEA